MKIGLLGILTFLSTLILCLSFSRLNIAQDRVGTEPHKISRERAPRVGGVGIFIPLLIFSLFFGDKLSRITMLSAIPTFLIGFFEDLFNNIRASIRLIFAFLSAVLFIILTGYKITKIDIPFIDPILSIPAISEGFTVFAIAGIVNAYNIVDGLHGLSSGLGILALLTYTLLTIINKDQSLLFLSLLPLLGVMGFFVLNYPKGKVFLGDSGAYIIGFIIAILSVIFVNKYPSQISPWFPIIVVAYPLTETLFSIYRRQFYKRKKALEADFLHLHSLIFKRYVKDNAKTTPFILTSSLLFLLIAFPFKGNTLVLFTLYLLYALVYYWLYYGITHFCNPLIFVLRHSRK